MDKTLRGLKGREVYVYHSYIAKSCPKAYITSSGISKQYAFLSPQLLYSRMYVFDADIIYQGKHVSQRDKCHLSLACADLRELSIKKTKKRELATKGGGLGFLKVPGIYLAQSTAVSPSCLKMLCCGGLRRRSEHSTSHSGFQG